MRSNRRFGRRQTSIFTTFAGDFPSFPNLDSLERTTHKMSNILPPGRGSVPLHRTIPQEFKPVRPTGSPPSDLAVPSRMLRIVFYGISHKIMHNTRERLPKALCQRNLDKQTCETVDP